MIRLACETKFRILEPLEEYRASCPYILITVAGEHPHPIPLPQRTPLPIRSEILRLLDSFGEELLELTPSKFREHPLVDAFLRQRFPDRRCTPSLSDFHVSLANRSHIVTYINEAKKKRLSCRTIGDGKGLLIANSVLVPLTSISAPPSIGLVQSNSLVAEADKSTREETAIQLQNKSGDVVSSVGAWRDLDVKRRRMCSLSFSLLSIGSKNQSKPPIQFHITIYQYQEMTRSTAPRRKNYALEARMRVYQGMLYYIGDDSAAVSTCCHHFLALEQF